MLEGPGRHTALCQKRKFTLTGMAVSYSAFAGTH